MHFTYFYKMIMRNRMGDSGKRVILARESRGYDSGDALASAMGIPQGTISRIETGFIKKSKYLVSIAKFLKVDPLWITCEIGEDNLIIDSDSGLHKELINSSVAGITARANVKAGKWAEALEWPEEDQYQIPFDQKIFKDYPKDKVFALLVEGDSMDKKYPEGTYLYCIPLSEMTQKLKTDHYVIVERQHAGKYECTVKQIEFKQDGTVLLWPRSNNPDHASPLIISDPNIANRLDHTIIRVTARVIGSFFKESD